MNSFIKYGVLFGCLFLLASSKGFGQSYFDGNIFSGYEKALEAYRTKDKQKNIKIAKVKKHNKLKKQKSSDPDTSTTSNFYFEDLNPLMSQNETNESTNFSDSLSCTASAFLEFTKKLRLKVLLC